MVVTTNQKIWSFYLERETAILQFIYINLTNEKMNNCMCLFCIFSSAFDFNYNGFSSQSVCITKLRTRFTFLGWSAGQRLTPEWPQTPRGHKLSCHFSQATGQWPESRGQRSVHMVITGLDGWIVLALLSTKKGSCATLTSRSIRILHNVTQCHFVLIVWIIFLLKIFF